MASYRISGNEPALTGADQVTGLYNKLVMYKPFPSLKVYIQATLMSCHSSLKGTTGPSVVEREPDRLGPPSG